jgi:hypothetical protein
MINATPDKGEIRRHKIDVPEENPIRWSEKEARKCKQNHANLRFQLRRVAPWMIRIAIMRACPNTHCAVFGRIVYTVATRCPLCKWDLKPILPASEIAAAPKPAQRAPVS